MKMAEIYWETQDAQNMGWVYIIRDTQDVNFYESGELYNSDEAKYFNENTDEAELKKWFVLKFGDNIEVEVV